MAWSAEQRLLFIDFRLYWDGFVNRRDLMEVFGISSPQAAKDFRCYNELFPDNMEYDRKSKKYWAAKGCKGQLYRPDALDLLEGRNPMQPQDDIPLTSAKAPVAVVPFPQRNLDAAVVRDIYRAVRDGEGLRLIYQSMSSEKPGFRRIVPKVFVSDGFRWHVRAWDAERSAFADFVLSRIVRVEGTEVIDVSGIHDAEWEQTANLTVRPNGKLSSSQKQCIRTDYGMDQKSSLTIKVRRALLFYLLNALHLDFDGADKPLRAHPLVVENREEIARIIQKSE